MYSIDPPSGVLDDKMPWYTAKVGARTWDILKAKLTGGIDSGGTGYSSTVNLSDADADRLIENMKKDPRGYPQFNDSYDYLVKLPIYTLSQEEIDKLLKEKDELVSDHKDLSETTNQDMWLSELHLFEKLYNKTRKIKI